MPCRPLLRQASDVHPRDMAGDPLQSLAIGTKDELVDGREAEAQRRECGCGRLEVADAKHQMVDFRAASLGPYSVQVAQPLMRPSLTFEIGHRQEWDAHLQARSTGCAWSAVRLGRR